MTENFTFPKLHFLPVTKWTMQSITDLGKGWLLCGWIQITWCTFSAQLPTRRVLVLLIFSQNFSEPQILWSLCWVVFHALTLKFPIQTLLSVVPKLPVYTCSGEKCENFSKTSTPQQLQPLHYSHSYSEVRAVLFFVSLINMIIVVMPRPYYAKAMVSDDECFCSISRIWQYKDIVNLAASRFKGPFTPAIY